MLTLILLGVWARASEAHKPSDSYLTLIQPVKGAALEGQWDIALRDLEHAVGLDGNADGAITWRELRARQLAVTRYALSRLKIEAIARGERQPCSLQSRALLFDEHVDGGYAVVRLLVQCPMRAAPWVH
jgi:hypothetical protein